MSEGGWVGGREGGCCGACTKRCTRRQRQIQAGRGRGRESERDPKGRRSASLSRESGRLLRGLFGDYLDRFRTRLSPANVALLSQAARAPPRARMRPMTGKLAGPRDGPPPIPRFHPPTHPCTHVVIRATKPARARRPCARA